MHFLDQGGTTVKLLPSRIAPRPHRDVPGGRRRARRALLASVAAFGTVLTLAGTTGVFAVFTDQTTTGTNTWTTSALPRSADLQLATGSLVAGSDPWHVDCGTYADDLESGVVNVTDAVPGDSFTTDFLCLKNVGSQTVNVTTSAIDVADLDTACTGDEGAVDTTCGLDVIGAAQVGELSPLVRIGMHVVDCIDANQGGVGLGALADLSNAPVRSLSPGVEVCVRFEVSFDPTESQAITAQSDTVTWRFAFDGTVPNA